MKNIKDLVPVDYSNQRVLTTAQLAEVYGVEPTRIRDNFRKAKKHFVEGEHYFKLEGEKLKVFKERVEEIMFSFSPVKGSGKDAETFRSAGGYKIQNPLFNITRSLLLWTHEGCVRHCKMLRKPDAFAIFEELKRTYFEVGNKLIVPQIVTVQGIKGYVDKKGVAWLNVDDVAFKLGISQTKNGVEYVRYERINEWIREYGFSPEVGKGDYVPEHVVYLLAMKANNDTAKAFQLKIATEILPSIRKYGYYISEQAMQGSLFPDEEPVKKIARRPVPELAFVYGLKLSNGLTKIGVAKDLTARMKDLQKETKADVIDWVVSALMTRDEALLLERALKAKFFDYIVSGEFFNCDFEAVKAALKGSPVDKLLEIAREMEPSPEKNTLLLQAAALLA